MPTVTTTKRGFISSLSLPVEPAPLPKAEQERLDRMKNPALYNVPEDTGKIKWLYPTDVSDSLQQEWTTDRIERARGLLSASIKPSGALPQSDAETQMKLDTWWKDAGQYMPRRVLDELGIVGGQQVPVKVSDLQADRKESAKHLKRMLGIKIEGDPLQAMIEAEKKAKESDTTGKGFDPFDLDPDPTTLEMIKSSSDEDLDIILNVMNKSFMDFPTNVVKAAVEEKDIRDKIEELMPALNEKPLTILLGTDFFNTLGFDLPEYLSRKGIIDKDTEIFVKAVARIREQIAQEDGGFLVGVALESGGVMADLIKFAAMPDVSKIAYFKNLSPAVKAAIGVGTKAGFIELLNAPKEGETWEQRAKTIAVATGVGALTGAILSKVAQAIRDVPLNKQAAKLNSIYPQVSKNEWVDILKVAREGELLSLKIQPRTPPSKRVEAPKGFRPGFADIEKPSKAIGKALAKASEKKVSAGAAVETAKALATKAVPVKKVEEKRIVSAEAAGPFKITAKLGASQGTKIVADPSARRDLQGAENRVAILKTRLAQTKADAKVDKVRGITIEKA